ncbi:MAG: lysophospholipase [Anaerolineales bacterium]|nr:lysophospholipase [Anaerolineales bacterium]
MADNQLPFKLHSVILFQGDSITDAGRTRSRIGPNSPDGLGFGYARKIADALLANYPEGYLQLYNRGVSGDRIQDMISRWEGDSLRLLPDLISILIGVNDTWNQVLLGMGSDPEQYQAIFHKILTETQQSLPKTRLVLCEPFLLLTGEVTREWSADITRRQGIVRDLADEFNAIFVPFQSALDLAAQKVSAHLLLEDGVHPTDRGHQVLADCWMKTVLG